jgi:large subunit ribosomal protein L19
MSRFILREGLDRLPNVKGILPKHLGLNHHPWHKRQPQTLLRAIDFESRLRHDTDGRTKLFSDEGEARPGCILLVEQNASLSAPRKLEFAGVLLAIRRKGILTNIILRSIVGGVTVEQMFPIYSPMIQKFTVLQPAPERLLKRGILDNILEARTKPKRFFVDFNQVEQVHSQYKADNQSSTNSQQSKVSGK